jgi:hypothetical protein
MRAPIVVDDAIAAKAAPAEMILGQDYMQPRHGGVIVSPDGKDVVA